MKETAADGARTTGPALEAHYRFLLWLVPAVECFPRSQRFLLGDRIQNTALDVLESLTEATCTRQRGPHLARANLGLEKLRFLMRLAHDLGPPDHRSYKHAARCLDETGRKVGAWSRTHRAVARYERFRDRFRHVLRCDICRYFPAIDHDILKRDLRRAIFRGGWFDPSRWPDRPPVGGCCAAAPGTTKRGASAPPTATGTTPETGTTTTGSVLPARSAAGAGVLTGAPGRSSGARNARVLASLARVRHRFGVSRNGGTAPEAIP